MIERDIKINATVGSQSLVCIGSKLPVSKGNYFSTRDDINIVNMWAENLKHLIQTGVINDGIMAVTLYTLRGTKWAVVTDNRVPKDYLHSVSPCFTGIPTPPLNYIEDMFQYFDNKDGLLEYTDPKLFWEKRGAEYIITDNGFAVIRYNNSTPKRKVEIGT